MSDEIRYNQYAYLHDDGIHCICPLCFIPKILKRNTEEYNQLIEDIKNKNYKLRYCDLCNTYYIVKAISKKVTLNNVFTYADIIGGKNGLF